MVLVCAVAATAMFVVAIEPLCTPCGLEPPPPARADPLTPHHHPISCPTPPNRAKHSKKIGPRSLTPARPVEPRPADHPVPIRTYLAGYGRRPEERLLFFDPWGGVGERVILVQKKALRHPTQDPAPPTPVTRPHTPPTHPMHPPHPLRTRTAATRTRRLPEPTPPPISLWWATQYRGETAVVAVVSIARPHPHTNTPQNCRRIHPHKHILRTCHLACFD